MGHASPDVTHRHYVHLADVLLKEWIDKEQIRIDDKGLAYAYQTSYANIRQLRSRHGKDTSLVFLSEHFTRKSNIPVPELHSATKQEAPADIPSSSHAGLKPSDIDRLLAIATMRDSIDGLADRFLTSEEQVVSILLSASAIQEKTGYDAFSIPAANEDDFWVFSKGARQDTLDKESRRVRAFLERIDQPHQLGDALSDVAEIWEDSFNPHANCLLISKRSEFERLLDCLGAVGIPAENFEVQIPKDLVESVHARWESTQRWLKSLGLSIHMKDRLPLSASRRNSDNRVGLILRASTSHELGYQQTLNRVLFILAVWSKSKV